MAEIFDIKQAIAVAIKKDLPVPDESSGEVFYEASASLVGEDEFGAKSIKVGTPSDKQMELINSKTLEPQEKENWMIIKGINPLGVGSDPDSHHDVFDKAAERDMAKQAFWTPILKNHDHEMNPPIGRCLEATAGKEGLRETWAIPKASYNAEYREALMHGNMPEISIGAFIAAGDKICNSCGDKSIYSMDCPHYPGDKNNTTVTIKRVKRYAERSLVNIPARMGTSVKGLAPVSTEIETDLEGKSHDDLQNSIKELNLSLLTPEDIQKAMAKAINSAFEGSGAQSTEDPEPPATISDVINEDVSIMSAEKDVKAPEAQEPSEKEEIVAAEAPVTETKAEEMAPEPEVKEIEVAVVKSLEVEELTKSFNESVKTEVESVNKALAEVSGALIKQQEFSEKQGEALKSLTDSVAAIAEQIAKLASLSTEEAVEKLMEVAGQLKEQVAPVEKKPSDPLFTFVDSLRK